MKTRWMLITLFAATVITQAQGTFQNLNFESANVSGFSPGSVPFTNALPGWSGYTYGGTNNMAVYNTVGLGSALVTLQGPGSSYPIAEGNYMVILQGSSGGTPSSAAIGQVGTIPVTMQSLLFWGNFVGNLTFNGEAIPYSILENIGSYSVYGGNVAAFAGQTGELRFSTPVNTWAYIDNIQMSMAPVPEPSTFALIGIGAFLFVVFQRKCFLRK
jgi:hypothetical protein